MHNHIWRISLCFILIAALWPATAGAQEDTAASGWKKTLVFDLTTTQAAYSDSWQGGEAGSFNWVSNLNGSAAKHILSKIHFRTVLKLSFGETRTQNETTGKWSIPRKTTDKIDWENVALLTALWPIDPYASFRLESRFYDGSQPSKRLYLSPVKLTESAGIAHRFHAKDDDFVEFRIGFALQQEITKFITDSTVSVTPVKYNTADSTKSSGGIEVVTDARLKLRDNINYVGKLTLYQALFFSQRDALVGTPSESYWRKMDIEFDNVFTASITRLIRVNLNLEFRYDKEVSPAVQIRETIALGLAINFAG